MKPHPIQYGRAYVLSDEIFPGKIGPHAVPNLVRRLNPVRSLTYLAKLNWIYEDNNPLDFTFQFLLVPKLISQNRRSATLGLLSTGYRILFFGDQFLILSKYIAIHSLRVPQDQLLNNRDLVTLGTALFGVTDLIASESQRLADTLRGEERLKRITAQLVLGEHLIKSRNLTFDAVRSKYLYVYEHEKHDEKIVGDYVDLDKIFSATTGMTINRYFEICFGLLAYYLRFKQLKFEDYPSNDFVVISPSPWLEPTEIHSREIHQIMSFLSQTLEEFKEVVTQQDNRQLAHDFLALKEKPLIEIGKDKYLLMSFNFLCERITTGIYWAIFDSLLDSEDRLKFSRYNGFLFENYVAEIAKEINLRTSGEDSCFYADEEFNIGRDILKTSDAILESKDSLICIEVTASRFKAQRTMVQGKIDAFIDDLEKIIFEKVEELSRFISRIRANQVHIDGKLLDANKKIYPVLLTIESFPLTPHIMDYILEELKKRNLLGLSNLAPFSLLSIEDLENVDFRSNLDMKAALDGWHSSSQFPYKSLSSYLDETLGPVQSDDGSIVSMIFNKLVDESTMTIFGLSFEEIRQIVLESNE